MDSWLKPRDLNAQPPFPLTRALADLRALNIVADALQLTVDLAIS
jgi:hypothetical protein